MHKRNAAFRIVKRSEYSVQRMILYYIIAILLAFGIGGILLAALKVDVIRFYKEMLTIGMLDNAYPYRSVEGLIKVFVPLVLVSLALSLAYRMKFWNVGGEGQFIVGALGAAWVAMLFGERLSTPVMLLLMILAGGLFAGLFGVFTAVLKVRFGTNETLLTLMCNYIALYVLKYFGETKTGWNLFLSKDSARPKFEKIPPNAFMPTIQMGRFSLNISLLLAIVFTVFMIFYLNKSKQGYEISVVGDSVNTAKYAGMKVGRIIIRTVFLSAMVIGVAGACHVSTSHTLSTSITNNVGWTGVIVAWLAKLNPIGILVTSFLISVLQYGTSVANANFTAVDANFANLLQGIILFIILAVDFLLKFKIVRTGKTNNNKEVA